MPETFTNILPYTTGALFGLALLLFLVSFRLFRRSRRDVFWRRRREAGQRGWRLFVLAFVLLIFSGASCGITLLASLFSDDAESTLTPSGIAAQDTPTLAPTIETIIATDTPQPTEMPVTAQETPVTANTVVVVITATPADTPTQTPFPTFTPENPPLVSSITPQPNAQIIITALDDQISDTLTPLNPRNVFDVGTARIYLFVEFRGMAQGVLWKRHLYRNNELIDGNAYLWGLENEGTGYFFFGSDSGFEPGQYEIRLFIGESSTPINTMAFSVAP